MKAFSFPGVQLCEAAQRLHQRKAIPSVLTPTKAAPLAGANVSLKGGKVSVAENTNLPTQIHLRNVNKILPF